MNKRIKKLREVMKREKLDGFIVSKPENIYYLTNILAEGILLLTKEEQIFVTNSLYKEQVLSILTLEDEIQLVEDNKIDDENYYMYFEDCENVGFEERHISYFRYKNLVRKFRLKNTQETDNLIEKMRLYKDKDEILKIEKACNITDACFLHLQKFIKIGMTERQIAFEIEKYFIEHGASGLAFPTIVASGENSAMPHANVTNRKIKEGDNIVLDFGAKYEGYSADMTRTIFVKYADVEKEDLYNLVLDEQMKAYSKFKAGINAKEIAAGVNAGFDSKGYELIHALGHGVGLEVHEEPILSHKMNYKLENNMVFTNEPGIYKEGEYGIRIEDTVVIENNIARNLTKSNKNLIIING